MGILERVIDYLGGVRHVSIKCDAVERKRIPEGARFAGDIQAEQMELPPDKRDCRALENASGAIASTNTLRAKLVRTGQVNGLELGPYEPGDAVFDKDGNLIGYSIR